MTSTTKITFYIGLADFETFFFWTYLCIFITVLWDGQHEDSYYLFYEGGKKVPVDMTCSLVAKPGLDQVPGVSVPSSFYKHFVKDFQFSQNWDNFIV